VSRRPLVLLEAANLIGGVSNALVMIVIPWLVLDRTGSAAAAGLAGALAGLPGIVVAPLVGAAVDRLGRKTVSVAADALSAISVLLFPVLDGVGRLDLGAILALTVLGAAFDPAGYTARKALIPDVARASGASVDHVNGLHEGLFAAGWVIGPMLGAFAIASVGAADAMWFAFGAFLLAAAAVALLRVPDRVRIGGGEGGAGEGGGGGEGDDGAPAPHESLRASVAGGVRALLADRPVWILTVAVAVVTLIYLPTESVLLPVHFEALDSPEAFGLTLSALAAGGMLGAFGYGWIAARLSRYRIATLFLTLACVAYVPLAFLPPPALMLVPAFLLGLGWGPMEPLLNSLVQDRFPPHLHGRVYGVQLALYYAAPPLGQLLVGVAAERFGVAPAFVGVAVAMVVTAVVVDFLPVLRGLDDRVL